MGFRDALLRALRPRAEALINDRFRESAKLDPDEIVDETLRQFRAAVTVEGDLTDLRARLRSFVDEALRNR